jgi:hypothetical protein
MVGSISLASEVLLLLLVPTYQAPAQIKCAKNSVRHLRPGTSGEAYPGRLLRTCLPFGFNGSLMTKPNETGNQAFSVVESMKPSAKPATDLVTKRL